MQQQRQQNLNNNQVQNQNIAMQQAMMQQGMSTSTSQQIQSNQGMPGASQTAPPREKIWSGILEWHEKSKSADQSKVPHQVPCFVTAKENDADMYVKLVSLKMIEFN